MRLSRGKPAFGPIYLVLYETQEQIRRLSACTETGYPVRYDTLVNGVYLMCDSVLLLTFGLLDAKTVPLPEGTPDSVEQLDYLRIARHGSTVVASCQCRRTPPIALHASDFSRRCRLATAFACPICTSELKQGSAASASDRFQYWLMQHKYVIDQKEHLYASVLPKRLVDMVDGTLMRPRRFIYAKFYGVDLSSKDKVLMKCGDANCLNPHHMHLAASPAKKVSSEMHFDILKWAQHRMTNKAIQELLEIHHGKNISVRTISALRNRLPQSEAIAI